MRVLTILLAISNSISANYFIALKTNDGILHIESDKLRYFCSPVLLPNKYYADPFIFKHDGISYLFFEDFDYGKGKISFITINEFYEFSAPEDISLGIDCHTSFPFIFKENEEIYMIPETSQKHEVCIYQAVLFPKKWKKVATLVRGESFADSILFKHNGYYWLFTADYTNLRIFYSKNLFGGYKPHPINLLNKEGRNAGNILIQNNELIRPVMNCSPHYGHSISFKKITCLTPAKFEEKEIFTILPTWLPNLMGTHTINLNEDFIVYDGKYSNIKN